MFSRSYSKKAAIGLTVLILIGGLAVAAPPHTPAGPVTDVYVGPIQTLTFGKDHSFAQGEVNFAWNDAGCETDNDAECSGDPQPGGVARAKMTIDDRTGTGSAERGVGVRYYLAKACDQQNVTLPISAVLSWDQNLDARDRSLGTGSGAVATYLYAKSAQEPATMNGPYADNTNMSAVTGPVQRTISFSISGANQTYDTTIGVQATASVTDLPPPSHDYAHPVGTISLKSLDLSFGDSTAPTSTTTVSALGAGGSATGQFKGYYKTIPSISVDVFDPIVSGQNTIPHSCVDRVNLGDGLAPLPVDYFQNDVTRTFSENRRYDLEVAAVDKNENTQAATKISFVVDRVLPNTTANIWPATPTGNNTWYKGPAKSVQFNVTCDDRNGHAANSGDFAGCSRSNWSISPGASSWTTPLDGTPYIVKVDTPSQGWNVFIAADSMDRATNQGNSSSTTGVKIDFLPPGIGFNRTYNSIYNNDWYNANVTVTFDCDGRYEISGCAHLRTKLNAGGFTVASSHTFTSDGQNIIVAQVEDVAGNQNNLTKAVKIDKTLPGLPNLPRLTSANRTVEGLPYVNQIPWFAWNAASDAGSGVRGYVASVDGVNVTANANNTAMAPTSLSQGQHTFRVSAVDNAGNVGNPAEVPFFFDNIVPAVSLSGIVPGKIYLWNGGELSTSAPGTNSTYAPVVVLRDYYINVSTSDGSPLTGSGMWTTKLYDAGGQLGVQCDADTETPEFCSLYFKKQQGLNAGPGSSTWLGRGEDIARNIGASLIQPVERVDIGVSNEFPGVTPPAGTASSTGAVFWSGYGGTDFRAYEIHRSSTPSFGIVQPNDPLGRPTTLVYSTSDRTANTWTDHPALVNGKQGVYYYQLVVAHGTGSLLRAYSHQTAMNYALDYLSDAVPCQAGALQCLD